ncbi:microtubule-associated protein futsch isoform X1 [Cinnamomum micranthum f. kanehirae]|uniref:Microtubule-associated protein futsch isoform X1 n=1 Tax=Cinnamomum micranthum f. kanehirae TaxID=337451 RepID=A0A443N2M7_9MAGN|nr:microtubule-associated protein futsch isoform X1 [Cinnamomum micranthum f. kanehirae]
MTAETNVFDGVSDGSKVELEGKVVVNLSSGGDLANAGGDCNGIAKGKEEELGREAEEETDASYVFVNGGSDDPDERDLGTVDPKKKSIEEGNDESELNAESLIQQTVVESEGPKEEKGERGKSCAPVEESGVSVGVVDHDEFREEKGENGEICLENGCFVESSGDGSREGYVQANGVVEDRNKLENQESQITGTGTGTEGVESELSLGSREDDVQANGAVAGGNKLENEESQINVMEGVDSELTLGSLSKETMVELEESEEEKGESGESFVENGCTVEEIVINNGVESEELREKGEGCVSCVENGCFVEKKGVFASVDGLHEGLNEDDVVVNDSVESQKELKLVVGGEDNQVSQTVVMGSGESELNASSSSLFEQTVVEPEELKEEKGEIGESCMDDSCVVEESAVFRRDELEQLREENGENGESCVVHSFVEEGGVSSNVDGPHDESNKDDVEAENIIEGTVADVVKSEDSVLHPLERGNEMEMSNITVEELPVEESTSTAEMSNIVVELPVEESTGELGMEQEMKPEITSCSMGDEKLESEVGDGHVELAESHSEVTNGSEVTGELKNELRDVSVESDMVEAENGSVEGIERMPTCSVAVLNPEAEITNVSIEAGNIIEPCSVDNFGLESQVPHAHLESSEIVAVCSSNDTGLESEVRDYFIENGRDLPVSPANDMESEGKVENGSAVSGTNFSAHQVDELKSENEDVNGHVETVESLTACPVNEESEIGEKDIDHVESADSCVDGSKSKNEATNSCVESSEILVTSPADDLKSEDKVTNGHCEGGESLPTCSIPEDSEAENRKAYNESGHSAPPSSVNEDPEADVLKDEVKVESEVKIDLVESSESAPDCVFNVVVGADNEEQSKYSIDDDDDKTACEEAKGGEEILSDEVLKPSQEDASGPASDGMKVDVEPGKRLPNFIIKIPRYADDEFRAQIKIAQLQVDEKTQHRDSIRVTMQQQKATCNEYWEKFEMVRQEERAARDAVIAKRRELDSIQLVINRMRNATSIEDIEEKIHNMEHKIEHETMPLTEEKQLIREIKQLKHAREQLCANSGTQAEIQEAFDQKDSIEGRFKLLKKELDSLRSEVQRTEGITKAAKKKHYDECEKLKELQAQFKAADNLRQEAYAHLQELKKQSYEKNKYFRMYKDDERVAAEYVSKGDREALQRLCANQVEKIMELWNNNDEFRKDYVQHNMMSTLRRLRTLDGRSLGPDEKPPVLRNFIEERTDAAHLASKKRTTSLVASAPEMKREKSIVPVSLEESVAKVELGQNNLSSKSTKTVKPTSTETVPVTISSRVEVVEETEKESKQTKEEQEKAKKAEELARKEEELRKEEAAAKLKEQRRLEEKAKAEAAEERKKRNAEKAQARAELRAKRDAELKEKEREKRLRKKERKQASAAGMMSGTIEGVPAEVSENSQPEGTQEHEIKQKPAIVTKRTPKSLPAPKQSKMTPLPPPLRNKGKRKMQSWMWVLLVAVLLLALFLVGNSVSSFTFGLPSFGF